jgi:hypothetical protein
MSVASLAAARAKKNFSALAFFSEHEGIVRDVWTVLGRPWSNLASELEWALREIPAGEHGKLKMELTDEQRKALLPLLSKMKFFRGLDPNAGEYGELHLTGAKYDAIVARIRNVRRRVEKGVADKRFRLKIGRWIGIFGQRPRTDWQDGSCAKIYSSLTDKVKQHPWVIAQWELELAKVEDANRYRERLEELPDGFDEWSGGFATEFHLGILAFIVAYDGDVEVGEYVASHEDLPQLPGVPKHTVASCTLILPDGTPVVVLNAPAVIRKMGAPRPTTVSGAEYWLKFYTPEPGATIVAVSGKTHWLRVIGDFEYLVHRTSPDVSVSGMSEAAVDSMAVLNNALAELVWLMQRAYNEIQSILTGEPVEL